MDVHVDAGPAMTTLGEVAAWSFELRFWGECGQGKNEREALANLAMRTGVTKQRVVERLADTAVNEAFVADYARATEKQIDATADIVRRARIRTIELLSRANVEDLEASDPTVAQPAWMPWRTAH